MTMSVVAKKKKKTRKSQLQSYKTNRTHFPNLWSLLVSRCCFADDGTDLFLINYVPHVQHAKSIKFLICNENKFLMFLLFSLPPRGEKLPFFLLWLRTTPFHRILSFASWRLHGEDVTANQGNGLFQPEDNNLSLTQGQDGRFNDDQFVRKSTTVTF